MRARLGLGVVIVAGMVGGIAGPALACGGLVGENGSIQLVRTSTLAAYHDGVERYVTSFEFVGEGAEVGSIIPLPDVPTTVQRGGDWTLQRLALEVAPPSPRVLTTFAAAAPDSAEVLLETQIDALDITILRGGGDEVGRWALDHGFFLTPDAPEILDFYASRSPVFMAARFDAGRAAALGQTSGDGTPIMLTIPTERPWVPLRILGLGAEESQVIDADVFLLTDEEPRLLAGGGGLTVERSAPAGTALLDGPAVRRRHGMDAELDVAHLPAPPGPGWSPGLRLGRVGRSPGGAVADRRRNRRARAGTGGGSGPAVVTVGAAVVARRRRSAGRRGHGRGDRRRAVDGTPAPGGGVIVRALLATGVTTALVTAWGYRLEAGGDEPTVLGPGTVEVVLDVEYTRFTPDRLVVREGTLVRFVLRNRDPILHELIVGPPDVHARHSTGTEAEHPPIPGEVTVQPNASAETIYRFDEAGTFVFACHLPGHNEYGMNGEVEVVPGAP